VNESNDKIVRTVWSGAVDLLRRLTVHAVDDILDGGDIAFDGFVDQGTSNVSLRPGPPCGLSFGCENCPYGQS
jgi:hypothetical protein